MKTLIILCLCTTLFISCEQAPTRYTTDSPEIDVLKTLIKDYNQGDWEGWASHYADTVKIYHNSLKPSSVSEIREGLQALLANNSEYGFSDKDIFYEMVIDDDQEKWVNFWGTWEGILAANGQKLVIPVHLTAQLVDGKIVEEHTYYNLSEFTTIMAELAAKEAMEAMEEQDE